MPQITPGDVRGPKRPRPQPQVGGDTYASIRERTPTLNPAEPSSLDELAVWGSVQVAHLFGLPPKDLTGVTYDFVRFQHRRRRPGNKEWAGLATRTPEGEQTIKIDARYATGFGDLDPGSRGLLLHEMTHIYMGHEGKSPDYDDSWVQEGLADYVKDTLGYGRPYRGDPLDGYQKGARFFMWLESYFPQAVSQIGHAMIEGADPYAAISAATGYPIVGLLEAYELQPNVPHATGPFAKYLKQPDYEAQAVRRRMRTVEGFLDFADFRRKKYGDWLGKGFWGQIYGDEVG